MPAWKKLQGGKGIYFYETGDNEEHAESTGLLGRIPENLGYGVG